MSFSRISIRRGIRTVLRSTFGYLLGKRGVRRVHALRLLFQVRYQAVLRLRGSIGRIIRRREVFLWIDGEQAFSRIEKLIRNAKHTVIIQMFIWKNDATGKHIAQLLLEAAHRGVRVDITKEATGDVFELHQDFLSTQYETTGMWKEFWSHSLISIRHIKHDHHDKVYIIDGYILMLGGMNIADEYASRWHDYMVEIRGERYVEQYLDDEAIKDDDAFGIHLCMNKRRSMGIRPRLMRLIDEAKHSLILEQSYFSDLKVTESLARASKRGVAVTLILPAHADLHHHANMKAVEHLLKKGDHRFVRVLLFPRFIHGKVMLIDRKRLFIGSANMMTSSLDAMGEVNVLIEGGKRRAVRKMREQLRLDTARSAPLLAPPRLWWIHRLMARMGL